MILLVPLNLEYVEQCSWVLSWRSQCCLYSLSRMSVANGLYNTSPSYVCIYFYYSVVILQASFGASNGPYKPVFTALSMTEIESSVNVDKAEPKHGQVQRKE